MSNPHVRNEESFQTALGIMADYIKFAQESLADEHEGNFKYYVAELASRAARLHDRVTDM